MAPHLVGTGCHAGLGMEWVHLSVCMSLDGHIDTAGGNRLVLSSEEDCHDMHRLRAECDAILVGAGTVRRDEPRLTVRYPELLAARRMRGQPDQPAKVTLTRSGQLDPASGFFAPGSDPIVLCPEEGLPDLRRHLGDVARLAALPAPGPAGILSALSRFGIRRLMVEGGCQVLTQFLEAGAFHRLRLAVAPFLLGQPQAPRIAGPGTFMNGPDRRLRILGTRTLGNIAVIDMENETPCFATGDGAPGG